MFRYMPSRGRFIVLLPWWLWLVGLLLWVVFFAAAFVLWILAQLVNGLDYITGRHASRALVRVFGSGQTADFNAARQQSIDRWSKS